MMYGAGEREGGNGYSEGKNEEKGRKRKVL